MTAVLAPLETDTGISVEAEQLFHDELLRSIESASIASVDRDHVVREAVGWAERASTDDWDGEGGRRVEQSTLRYATRFLWSLPREVSAPSVLVDRDGDYVFDWDSQDSTFSVSIGRDGTLTFAGLFRDGKVHGRELLGSMIPATVLLGISRVQSPL